MAEIRTFFPDARFDIDDLISDDDKVAGRITFRGTPDASAFRLPEQPGHPLEVGGVVFGVIADGCVSELWFYVDQAPLMALIGMATPSS